MGAKLQQEWEKAWKHIRAICALLESADEYKALVALRALIAKKNELESYIDEICKITKTDNIGNALKRIKGGRMGDSVFLPEQLQRIPQLWLEGRAETRKVKGVLKMTFYQAEISYRRLRPYLEDVWRIAEQRDSETAELLKEQILERYEECSADDMTKYCYAFQHDYDLTEDEEAKPDKAEEPSYAELMRTLSDMKMDYGTVSKEQFIEENQ